MCLGLMGERIVEGKKRGYMGGEGGCCGKVRRGKFEYELGDEGG